MSQAPAGHVVATAGHVDHGKSTLVRALTGTDPDRFEEERRRGLTIDLGFAWTTLPSGRELAFVDVPGHVRFLPNMLSGVGAVDRSLFVVDATEGWRRQSEEHLRILELLGVTGGVVAVTKADLADDDDLTLVHLDLTERLSGGPLADSEVVDVSAVEGQGMAALTAALDRLLDTTAPPDDLERPRLWIDRSFPARGAGTIVTGTLAGGALAVDEEVLVVGTSSRRARVRGIQVHGSGRRAVGPGHRVALNLAGIAHAEIGRGDAVITADRWEPTTMVDCSLRVLAALDHDVSRRGAFTLHVGSGHHPVRVRVLGTDTVPPGGHGLVRVHLPRHLPLLPGDRYVLRESGRDETVGGGEILDVAPVLAASKARPDRSVDRVVAERGWVDVDLLRRLTGVRRPATVGRWLVAPGARQTAVDALMARVKGSTDRGLHLAVLDERQRFLIDTVDELEVVDGRVVLEGSRGPAATEHPFLAALRAAPFDPPAPDGVDRAVLSDLVRRGSIVERDGIHFAAEAVGAAAAIVARLLATTPDGVTASAVREALDTSRRFALPLLAELDATGVTRRRGDVRIAGPRLPAPGSSRQ